MSKPQGILGDLRASRATALGFASVGIFWGSFASLVPDLKAEIGASDGAFGLAMFLASFGAIAAMWMAPRVDAAFGPRALQVAAAAMALCFLLPGLAAVWAAFTMAMVLASGGSGTTDVIMNMRVSEIEAQTGRSLMNLNHGIFSFAYAGAAFATGLGREAGLAPFPVFAMMAVLAFVMIAGMYTPQMGAPEGDTKRKISNRLLAVLGGAIILIAFMAEQATEAWSALLLERELGGSPSQGALGPAILGLTMGIGRIGGQVLLGRFGETRVIQLAALIAASGLYIAASADMRMVATLGFAILGLGISVTAPLAFSAVGKRVSNAERGAMITRISVIGYLGFFLGPPLMGGMSEGFGLRAAFLMMSAIVLVVAVGLAPALRRLPADKRADV